MCNSKIIASFALTMLLYHSGSKNYDTSARLLDFLDASMYPQTQTDFLWKIQPKSTVVLMSDPNAPRSWFSVINQNICKFDTSKIKPQYWPLPQNICLQYTYEFLS